MQRMAGDALFFLFLFLGPPPLIFGDGADAKRTKVAGRKRR
jgi:hypothetical protein